MENVLRAIEVTGVVDEAGQLRLDEPLVNIGPVRVRVILLLAHESDVDEGEWLRAAASNPAFAFLEDPAEDIYAVTDGKPFYDEG